MNETPARVTFEGVAFRTVPGDRPFEADLLISGEDGNDRWNRPGEPTIYLALDPGVAIAEAGRHLEAAGGTDGCQLLVKLRVRAEELVDLRDAGTRRDLGIEGGPAAFLDRERARELAARLRQRADCRGLLAPSMALIDHPGRGNLVVFAERLQNGPRDIILDHEEVGRLDVIAG